MARETSELSAQHSVPRTLPRVLITAGPTHEPIDAVRYIANRSSGRMGLALAQACTARGWTVTLLLGPVPASPPVCSQLSVHRFQTAAELDRLLNLHWPQHDLLLMAAAVADFTPLALNSDAKLKRSDQPVSLILQPTPDLLASLAASTRPNQVAVGFALEPADQLTKSAQGKLRAKRLDAIVANPLETLDSETITATVLFADGRSLSAPKDMAKTEFASWLVNAIAPLVESRRSARTD